MSDAGAPGAVSNDWRADAKRAQREVLDDGPGVVSGPAPYGGGGLGRHLAELVEALRDRGSLAGYLSRLPRAEDVGNLGSRVEVPRIAAFAMQTPWIRRSPGRSVRVTTTAFDTAASRRLPRGAEHLLAFNGAALSQMQAARANGYRSVGLVSANSHLANVARQHDKAWRQYPIEHPWGPELVARNLLEYQTADCIYVSSRYVWESFVAEGFPAERLRLFPLTPDERFQPRLAKPTATTFNVVYVGSLSVHKGVPLLIDSVRRLSYEDLRLTLVGGWGTRGMRRVVEAACTSDSRITARPGDPLPHLLQAGVCVHPSYEEGFGYAPAEALACGVPLIVSEDSAVKELCTDSSRLRVVPTGDLDALTEAIEAAYGGTWPP